MPLGGGAARRLSVTEGQILAVVPAADTVHLYVDRDGEHAAFRIPLAGGDPTREAPAPWVLVAPSPTGTTTLWVRLEAPGQYAGVFVDGTNTPDLTRVDVRLAPNQLSTPSLYFGFNARGTKLVYYDGKALLSIDTASRQQAPVELGTAVMPSNVLGVALAPDGETVYTSQIVGRVQRAVISNFADR